MGLSEFVQQVDNFDALSTREKIKLFAWHLHTHGDMEAFDNAAIRSCFRELHLDTPDVSIELPRMAASKPPALLRAGKRYKLEGTVRRSFDSKFGSEAKTIAVSNLLLKLPSKIPLAAERVFLAEAIDCYRVKAYRATIVMAWNLAFDHLLNWISADPAKLAAFNAAIPARFPKKPPPSIAKREDFEDIKEADIIELCKTAKLGLTKNQIDILREKLKRRNAAAHPSSVIVEQPQADDMISDLVNNIVLALE